MKISDVKTKWKQYQYVALVLGLGVVLLAWPKDETPEPIEEVADNGWSLQAVQAEMEQVLGCIDGVGQVQLMLSLDTEGTVTLAQDGQLSYSGDAQSPESYSRISEIIVVEQNGEERGLVTQQTYPVYRGALVVCEGGDNPTVRLAVTQGVAALTGLGTDRITVATWKSSFGGGTA
ncbi:hypothetical protein RFF05_01295 [Bengtsoniella intestinalis]|uniref:hypothetical protein n=1 Tax=Bengtsoniella intestinalis TaxID=3073143 RepID=UPI00391F8B2B